jgi:hypothetical protein
MIWDGMELSRSDEHISNHLTSLGGEMNISKIKIKDQGPRTMKGCWMLDAGSLMLPTLSSGFDLT